MLGTRVTSVATLTVSAASARTRAQLPRGRPIGFGNGRSNPNPFHTTSVRQKSWLASLSPSPSSSAHSTFHTVNIRRRRWGSHQILHPKGHPRGNQVPCLRHNHGEASTKTNPLLTLTQREQRLGGRVEDKIPRAGYVLIQPDTPEGHRLKSCWLTSDRPERFVVPYTFVEICESKGILLKQIFIHEDRPMGIHIHRTIANVIVRGNIAAIIAVRPIQLVLCRKRVLN